MNGDGHAGHMPQSGRGMAISAWLTGVYFVIELAIGLWTGSIAVISDAFHTLRMRKEEQKSDTFAVFCRKVKLLWRSHAHPKDAEADRRGVAVQGRDGEVLTHAQAR